MLLLIAVVLGALTAPLAGGRLSRLVAVELRLPAAPVVAVVLQAAIGMTADRSPAGALAVLHVVSFLVAGTFVVANRRVAGMLLLGLGGGMNFAAIALNRGVMPASPSAVARAGLVHDATRFHNSAVVAEPRLGLLGDVFAVPAAWPFTNVFSIGDVLLFAGAILIVHGLAGAPWTRRLRPRLARGERLADA